MATDIRFVNDCDGKYKVAMKHGRRTRAWANGGKFDVKVFRA